MVFYPKFSVTYYDPAKFYPDEPTPDDYIIERYDTEGLRDARAEMLEECGYRIVRTNDPTGHPPYDEFTITI